MFEGVREQFQGELDEIAAAGLGKQRARDRVAAGRPRHARRRARGAQPLRQQLPRAGQPSRSCWPPRATALDERGYGMASVRFICGTQDIHSELEERISEFLGTEDTILYASCFDANGGLFETLLGEQDAIISDELNHASIIDGIRLCKAQRLRYANGDIGDLEARLREASRRAPPPDRDRRRVLDGRLHRAAAAHLRARREVRRDGHGRRLARRRLHGPGRPRHAGAARRRRARRPPHRHARQGARRRERRLHERAPRGDRRCCGSARGRTCSRTASRRRSSAAAWPCSTCSRTRPGSARAAVRAHARASARAGRAGLDVVPGEHPIVPVMFGDAHRPRPRPSALLEHGVYVIAFSYPVVPLGQARIRIQLSAALSDEDVDRAIAAFGEVATA